MTSPLRIASVLLIAGATLLVAAGEAQARTRQSTVTGAQGKSATRAVTRHRGDVQSGTTGPNGQSSSRVVEREPGQTTATVTGPKGKTASRTTSYGQGGASAPQP